MRALFLLLVAVAIHAPALSGQFLWDDDYLAHDNPFIKSPVFALEAFRHYLFLDSFSAHYRPVQNLSFIVDYFFWNDDAAGFHLTNIGLHAASGVLLYFLSRRLLKSLLGEKLSASGRADSAFLLALLWTVHPVHSAAVDYISGRADSLAFFFAAAGWLLFLRAHEVLRRRWRITFFAAAATCALLALCSRETAALWLIIFLVHTMTFSQGLSRSGKLAVLGGCLTLCFAYYGLRQLPERRTGEGPKPAWTGSVRAVLMLRALGDYARLMVFPANLHMERTVVDTDNYQSHATWRRSAGTEYLSLGGVLLAGILAHGCRREGIGQRTRIFGAVWFAIGFLPISNLFDLNATVAEHWLYLPSVGLLIFAVGIALDFPEKFRRVLAGAALLAALGLGLRSFVRSGDWTTPEHFYEQTIAAGGTSIRVSLNLGQLYANHGEYARAEKCFRQILTAYPEYPIARNNLANTLFHEGKRKEAEALFAAGATAASQDSKEFPRTWIAALNLAGLLEQRNDLKGAFALLEKTRAAYPHSWEVVGFESELLRKNQGAAAAIPLVENFKRDHWWNYEASLALGRLRAQNGENDLAEAAWRNASWLDVHEVEALNRLAEMRVRQNRLTEAYTVQGRAIARQPGLPREYVYLSRILEKMGRNAEAEKAVATATRLAASARAFAAAGVD